MAFDTKTTSWFHITSAGLDRESLLQLTNAYPVTINAISIERGKKPSKHNETLASLDTYRYEELPLKLQTRIRKDASGDQAHGYLELDDLKRLLEWKMSRGVFRPTLRSLISSNSNASVRQTTAEAYSHLQEGITQDSDSLTSVIQALKIVCRLKGVGPATASLILSVANPSLVPFFGDELFAWINLLDAEQLEAFLEKKRTQGLKDDSKRMRVDRIAGTKYTEAEYKTLYRATTNLKQRLKVKGEDISAIDIEKAAFVVLQGSEIADLGAAHLHREGDRRDSIPCASVKSQHTVSRLDNESEDSSKSQVKSSVQTEETGGGKRRRSTRNSEKQGVEPADSNSTKRRKTTSRKAGLR